MAGLFRYRVSFADTTQPRLVLNYQMAKTPSTITNLALPEGNPRRPDYRVTLTATTQPVECMNYQMAKTPSISFNAASIQEEVPRRSDYRVALADTTQPRECMRYQMAATPSTYFPLFVCDERPVRADYQPTLKDTAKPIIVLNYQMAVTPLAMATFVSEIPIRADIIGIAIKATTAPIWPQAPPPAATTPTPTNMEPLFISDERPPVLSRGNYQPALANSSDIIRDYSFRTAQTPSVMGSVLFLSDERPIRADIIGVSLKDTSQPIWAATPPPAARTTPAAWFNNPYDLMPDRVWS